jgi:hypothetical protein
MAEEKKVNPYKVLTPEFKASFPFVFKARINPDKPDADPKFGVTMLFQIAADPNKPDSKVVDIRPLVAAAQAAAAAKWGVDSKAWPANLTWPFKKGEEKAHLDGYGAGIIAVNTTTEQQPPYVKQDGVTHITDPKEMYPGVFARAVIVAFAYEARNSPNGPIVKKGVSFGLRHIQKVRDGKLLGGGSRPEEDFTPIEEPVGAIVGADNDLGIPGLT